MNWRSAATIYRFEIARAARTPLQSVLSPVLSASLYFIVFGSAMAGRLEAIDGVPYGAFIVPGLVMLTVLVESVANASFGIYLPRFTGTIYEVLSAPIGALEILAGYVGAAATKSIVLGGLVLLTAAFFVDYPVAHPLWAALWLVVSALTFSLLGFVIGVWSKSWEQLQLVPYLVVMPLTFLGGTFYDLDVLRPPWRDAALFNPAVYLIDGFRTAFFGRGDLPPAACAAVLAGLCAGLLALAVWMIRSGYRLKP
ncbi:MAG: transport permease protein [Gammaproteobacteria bacterium]|nr:MAG: transport permease protein [Gammaproteobacteria bacterium]